MRALLRRGGPALGLAAAWLLFAVLAGSDFAALANQRLMLLQTAVVGTAAVGATLIIVSGGIDLSVGSTIALGTMTGAIALRTGCSPAVAALAAIGTGVLVGALIGMLVTLRLRLSPFIVTLGMWGALRGLAKGLGQNQPVYPKSTGWLADLMLPSGFLLPPGVWILLALAAAFAALLRFTRLGRHALAVGSNEETARLCGVDVARTKFLVYVLGVGCAGVASVLQLSYLSMGDPTTAQGAELKVIAAVVIGGASLSGGEGSIVGTLLGALLMTVVDSGCTKLGLDNWVQECVTGAIIVAAVAIDRLRHRSLT
ncbi:MAG TPA: ABC transporter permease [Planctomycetota bacterium]|nr:ABC transporter permease [Planctomycetota bacterium]